MAKAGAQAGGKKADASMQFQIEAENEMQWRSLLRREGLIVIDVYASWAGPCVSMVPTLKRVKVEVHDERLWYGMACSDNIDDLVKFKDQSEPCWLFIGGGKPIKVVRGSHVPNLVRTIKEEFAHEIECIDGKARRNVISIDDEVQRKLKLEAEASRLAKMLVEEEQDEVAAEALNEIRRESSISLMNALDPYTCLIIQPFLVEATKAKEIKDYISGDFTIEQDINVEMTEELVRKLYRIPWKIPDPNAEMEFGFDLMSGAGDDDTASRASAMDDDDEAPKEVKPQKKAKPKKKFIDVPLPEGLTGQCVMLLLGHESIKELAAKKQKPYDTLLQTADDWLRMRVGPIKFAEAVEHAPYCLHATYGKEGDYWPGVWCPRKYEDKRFIILNYFPSFMDTILKVAPMETRKYVVAVFAANASEAMNLNQDIQNNKFDINAEGKMKIPPAMAESMLKSWEVKKADMIMKKANLTTNDVYVVSYNPKNSALKQALTLMSPVHTSKDEVFGRYETAKLFPDLNLSPEEETTPEQFVQKFLARTKPRIESKSALIEEEDEPDDMPIDDGEGEEEEEDHGMGPSTTTTMNSEVIKEGGEKPEDAEEGDEEEEEE